MRCMSLHIIIIVNVTLIVVQDIWSVGYRLITSPLVPFSTTEWCYFQKFSENSAVFWCINGGHEDEYIGQVDWIYRFVESTGKNRLLLNVEKTKEMVIDIWRKGTTLWALHILDFFLPVCRGHYPLLLCGLLGVSQPVTPSDLTNGSKKLTMSLAAVRRLLRWWRGGHWANYRPSWTTLSAIH